MQACDFSDPGHGEILGKVLQNIGVDLMDDIVVRVCMYLLTAAEIFFRHGFQIIAGIPKPVVSIVIRQLFQN